MDSALLVMRKKKILVEYRIPIGKPGEASEHAAKLVQRKVDVIVASDPTAIRAAKRATKTIPIVMLTNQDPVGRTGRTVSTAGWDRNRRCKTQP